MSKRVLYLLDRAPRGSKYVFVLSLVASLLYGVSFLFLEGRSRHQFSLHFFALGHNPPVERDNAEPGCVLPKLDVKDPEIMQFLIKHPRLTCGPDTDWLIISKGSFLIPSQASKKHPDIECHAFPIVKVSDFRTRELRPVKVVHNQTRELRPIKVVHNQTRVDHDFFRVECHSSDGSNYSNYLAGIRYDPKVHSRPRASPPDGLDLDVIIFGLDSTSRLAWHRHLPKSREYFMRVLNGTEMEGYNILGDGTPAAIMPLLLGRREEELHEARKGYQDATPVDDFPWVWNDFRQAGYVLGWAEDDAYLGTFQYRLMGFRNQPTDHYFRYFCVAAEPHYRDFKQHCQGYRPRHVVVMDYVYQMFQMYPKHRKWIFSFQSQLSHDDNNKLSLMDDDLLEHLQRMHRNKRLDNAIFIMMADHGCRYSHMRATEQGKQEERLPYLGIRLPPRFHQKYPGIIRNLRVNSKRLTTPFDLHETLLEVLHFTGNGTADISKRGVSLFKEIPRQRDCDKASIDPHWCTCLDWTREDPSSQATVQVVATVLQTLNSFTAPYRNLCSLLALGQILSVSSMQVKQAVLKFKNTNDGGRGRFGSMTDKTNLSRILYQVTLTTTPGGGRFEVTVTRDLKTGSYQLPPGDISRTNRYGNSPWCVQELNSFLRPYCYCKHQPPIKQGH